MTNDMITILRICMWIYLAATIVLEIAFVGIVFAYIVCVLRHIIRKSKSLRGS